MRQFLIKVMIASALVLACHVLVLLAMDERQDPFYLKLATAPRSSLIIGTSRASQGIDPAVLDSALGLEGPSGMFNFAFTAMHSPFGPAYYRAIRKKVDTTAPNGLFVVTVDPWALSLDTDHRAGPSNAFPEDQAFLANMFKMNGTPNPEYFIRAYTYGWGSMLAGPLHKREDQSVVRPDGMLIVTVHMDSAIMVQQTSRKLAEYRAFVEGGKRYAAEREAYLVSTCGFLQHYGQVALVRLPVHPGLRALEDRYRPTFSTDMERLAQRLGTPWLDHSAWGDSLAFTDGNHLTYTAAQDYSRRLGAELERTRTRTGLERQ